VDRSVVLSTESVLAATTLHPHLAGAVEDFQDAKGILVNHISLVLLHSQRGLVAYLSVYAGDPTAPGYPTYENATRVEATYS
jgi:hypothetical protein